MQKFEDLEGITKKEIGLRGMPFKAKIWVFSYIFIVNPINLCTNH